MLANSPNLKKLMIVFIFIFGSVAVFHLDTLNSFAYQTAQNHSALIRTLIFAFYGTVYLSAYVARVGRQSANLVSSVQNFFTALPPVLGGYQLTVWLILDWNLAEPKYLPYADVIDSSVFIIAIILLFKLSAEHLVAEGYQIVQAFSGVKAVKVTASNTPATPNSAGA
ncbi:hypothetical protein [Vibrio rotiferianus]|uniref:hypothetical protein n=1 Tax=Vibrio rotiferianus TaxID=190895 RepID=UPI002895C67A|nr:membrane hypothetical protein [Vibrio rotiferianus]